MTKSELTAPQAPGASGPGWEFSPWPAVSVGADGTVLAVNRLARELLPSAKAGARFATVVPDWLGSARHDDPARASGWIGECFFEARPVLQTGHSVVWWLVEDTGAQRALRRERQRTAVLGEVSTALLGSLNLDRCLDVVARLAAEHLADTALVIAAQEGACHRAVRCVRGEHPVREALAFDPAEVAGLAEALQGFPPVPSRWLDPGGAPAWLLGEGGAGTGSIVVTPLPGHGTPAGVLVLLRDSAESAFPPGEESFARLFASRAGAAISAARMFAQQTTITETLMRDLLPPAVSEVGGVEFAGGYQPAGDSERVGGDFYDVHPLGEDGTLAVLGDVCGKGLEAAVLTGRIRGTLQALLPMAGDHHRMLTLLNTSLISSHHTRFATLVLATASSDGAVVRLRLTCAGHPPPLIVRAGGEVEVVDTMGTLIGVLEHVKGTTAQAVLQPGETCLLYTDGVTEARGGPLGDAMFGEARLKQALADCAGFAAETVVERVRMLVSAWSGQHARDDIAVLAITAPRERNRP
ncbi:SpoIIE family protein phosphatase [Amycolatopsis sp. K13G38]|uniref:SpoIIE family protein phosphatase n=1 Tax=Amycolatopsis acididurans TaxID=2724524 RepID=A0ABX1JJI0_9PSEU|nr:GAF domain-containing SpoIIE family protein phosphatase [Amycolatopsis acididurans]NKQ58615.1 SpoIIE family protein phosphatase [Amycolatopsis acididurans]